MTGSEDGTMPGNFYANIKRPEDKQLKPSPSDGVGGEYISGSEDGKMPGIFYANVRR